MSHRRLWLALAAVASAWLFWTFEGQVLARRWRGAPEPAPRGARVERRYLALLFPRIAPRRQRLAVSAADLAEILDGLRRQGFVSVGLEDLRGLHRQGLPLPRKALLLAFEDDRPESVALADDALAARRMRGVLFLSRLAEGGRPADRRYLSRHAFNALRRSGCWDFGALLPEAAPSPSSPARPTAALRPDPRVAVPAAARYDLLFTAADAAYNDDLSPARSLAIMRVRADQAPRAVLDVVRASCPRQEGFQDSFTSALQPDWAPVQGVVASGSGRLRLLPTPRHTGASVYLRGTERWRDAVVEFELQGCTRETWAYARFHPDGSYLRAGTRDGAWVVEQKIGPGHRPNTLARVEMAPGTLPATLRFVVKGNWALLQVNGRMPFGRALHVHPAVAYGRVQFATYDSHPRAATAALGWARAQPGGRSWVVVDPHAVQGQFERVREQALTAYAVSPRLYFLAADGTLARTTADVGTISALAGFYRCRLAPLVEVGAAGRGLIRAAASDALLARLADAALTDDSAGLNLRLERWPERDPALLAALLRLRAQLHARGCGLWVTTGTSPAAGLAAVCDGTLSPAGSPSPGLRLYRTRQPGPARAPRTGDLP